MLKLIKNDISNVKNRIDECTPHLDCSAHDAAAANLATAQANLQVAQANLTAAIALRGELNDELNNVSEALGDYKMVFDNITACGKTAASPSIMGDAGLSGMIDCLSTYGSNVEAAYNQAVSEVSRCEVEVAKCQVEVATAQTTLANTPCIWTC